MNFSCTTFFCCCCSEKKVSHILWVFTGRTFVLCAPCSPAGKWLRRSENTVAVYRSLSTFHMLQCVRMVDCSVSVGVSCMFSEWHTTPSRECETGTRERVWKKRLKKSFQFYIAPHSDLTAEVFGVLDMENDIGGISLHRAHYMHTQHSVPSVCGRTSVIN